MSFSAYECYANISGGVIYVENSTMSFNTQGLPYEYRLHRYDGFEVDYYDANALLLVPSNFANFGGVISAANNANISVSGTYGGDNHAIYGGVIYLNNSTLTSRNAYFNSHNYANYGGAIYLNNSSICSITESSFSDNNAQNGGAILINMSCLTILYSGFNDNVADNGGGALCAMNITGNLNILRSDFDSNSADNGGAIFITNCSGNNTILLSSFGRNHAINGGAVYLIDMQNIDMSVNLFGHYNRTLSKDKDGFISVSSVKSDYGNSADNGGAIFMQNTTNITLFRNIFTLNQAKNGGAIFLNNVSKINTTRNNFGGLSPFDGYRLDNIAFDRTILNVTNFTIYGHGYDYFYTYEHTYQTWTGHIVEERISNVHGSAPRFSDVDDGGVPVTVTIPVSVFQHSFLNVTHYLSWFYLDGNTAQDNGGGLYITNSEYIDIIDNQFNDCKASGGNGGAIFLENVSNINISRNHFGNFSTDFDYNDYNYSQYYDKYNEIFNMIFEDYYVPYNSFYVEGQINGTDFHAEIIGGNYYNSPSMYNESYTYRNLSYDNVYTFNRLNSYYYYMYFSISYWMHRYIYSINEYGQKHLEDDSIVYPNEFTTRTRNFILYDSFVVNITFKGTEKIFSHNQPNYAKYGGAIYIKNVTNLTIENNTFLKNTAENDGGALYIYNSTNINIENNNFTSNSAFNGGAIAIVSCSHL